MESNSPKKHYLIYKTTNLFNGKIYIGAHETNNLDDGYLGSGKYFHYALNKYGKENFKREILFELSSREEMFQKEKEIVNEEFIKREDTYNIKLGGDGGFDHLKGKIKVRDKYGNITVVDKDDERLTNGELTRMHINKSQCVNETGEYRFLDLDDPLVVSGEYKPLFSAKRTYINENGDRFFLRKNDSFIKENNLKLYSPSIGAVQCIDSNGKNYLVQIDDPRLESGELIRRGFYTGKHLSESAKKKISEANKISLRGEKNGMYGKRWIYNPVTKERLAIPESEIEQYLNLGWKLGKDVDKEEREEKRKKSGIKKYHELTEEEKKARKIAAIEKQKKSKIGRVLITNEEIDLFLPKEEAEKLVATGNWRYGRKFFKRRPRRWIHREDGTRKMVSPERVDEFLAKGWILGSNIKR